MPPDPESIVAWLRNAIRLTGFPAGGHAFAAAQVFKGELSVVYGPVVSPYSAGTEDGRWEIVLPEKLDLQKDEQYLLKHLAMFLFNNGVCQEYIYDRGCDLDRPGEYEFVQHFLRAWWLPRELMLEYSNLEDEALGKLSSMSVMMVRYRRLELWRAREAEPKFRVVTRMAREFMDLGRQPINDPSKRASLVMAFFLCGLMCFAWEPMRTVERFLFVFLMLTSAAATCLWEAYLLQTTPRSRWNSTALPRMLPFVAIGVLCLTCYVVAWTARIREAREKALDHPQAAISDRALR